MDQRRRSIAKALTWQALGLLVMTLLGFVATGSLRTAGGLALSAAAISTVTYILHERIWDHIRWGRQR